MKTCHRCQISKDFLCFHKDPRNRDAHSAWCKECVKWSSKRYYTKNKELVKRKSTLYYKINREKSLVSQRKYINSNKELTIGRQVMKYWTGVTPVEAYKNYMSLQEKQNNLCAICENPEVALDRRTGNILRLSIDHCHNTGKVRGLLCNSCNKGLGLFKDNVIFLKRSLIYLSKEKNNL